MIRSSILGCGKTTHRTPSVVPFAFAIGALASCEGGLMRTGEIERRRGRKPITPGKRGVGATRPSFMAPAKRTDGGERSGMERLAAHDGYDFMVS